MAFTCDSCRKKSRTKPHVSMTGRRLCDRCNARLLGATAALSTGGTPTDAFATAAGTELAGSTRRRLWGRRKRQA